jgi:hypothetical protein
MNLRSKLTLIGVTLVGVSSISIASENLIAVDKSTPDSMLLAQVDKQEMFKVIQPSTNLTMKVEGIDSDIRIEDQDGATLLKVNSTSLEGVSVEQATEITNTYRKVMGNQYADVKLITSQVENPSSEE